jgi:hypothetical protein
MGFPRFIFLPDSPVKAKGLNLREKRIAVERLRENQTGVENKVRLGPMHLTLRCFADKRLSPSTSNGTKFVRLSRTPRRTYSISWDACATFRME